MPEPKKSKPAILTDVPSSIPASLWFYAEELHRLIELEAYYLAEIDGFRKPPLDYWLEAERLFPPVHTFPKD